jgi:hypothetical protein
LSIGSDRRDTTVWFEEKEPCAFGEISEVSIITSFVMWVSIAALKLHFNYHVAVDPAEEVYDEAE